MATRTGDILFDRSSRPKLGDHELQELNNWLSDRTIIFRKGSSTLPVTCPATRDEAERINDRRSPHAADLVTQIKREEDGESEQEVRISKTTNSDRIDGLVSDAPAQFFVSYPEACQALNLDPRQPKVLPQSDFILHPHQVTGIYSLMLRETDALPFHIFADEFGLGKTSQLLHLIYLRNIEMEKQNAKEYKVSVILAPVSTCGTWLDHVQRIFPSKRKGLSLITFYSIDLFEGEPNYSRMSDLLYYCKKLKQDDPATGRVVILSTYTTFLKYALTLNDERQTTRQDEEKMPKSYRDKNFAPEDFDVIWNIPTERIIIDDAHNAKNPTTRINATICRLNCSNFWFVSGSPVTNTVEDILGALKIMKPHLEAADFGVREVMNERDNKFTIKMYQDANIAWRNGVTSWETARTIPKGKVQDNIRPWFNHSGMSTAEMYGLHLLHYDVVMGVLTDARNGKSRVSPYLAKEVVGLVLRMLMIRRTRNSEELAVDKDGLASTIRIGDTMRRCTVSTVDLAPGCAEYNFYQQHIAPYQAMRANHHYVNGLLPGQNELVLNSTYERVLIAATSHFLLGKIVLAIEAQRKQISQSKRLLDPEQQAIAMMNNNTMSWEKQLLAGEIETPEDHHATDFYWRAHPEASPDALLSRTVILKHLLVDSTKYRYMAMALIKAKTTGERVIILVTYPIQQIFLEMIACLLKVPVVSISSTDSPSVRHSKVGTFNNPQAPVLAFLSTTSIAGYGLSLHHCCKYMIQCDIAKNIYSILQMQGRVDCVGQSQEARVEILALDYTTDVRRQGYVADKAIPILAAMMEYDGKYQSLLKNKSGALNSISEEYIRRKLGQTCSLALWSSGFTTYYQESSDSHIDLQLKADHIRFEELLRTYMLRGAVSANLGDVDGEILPFESRDHSLQATYAAEFKRRQDFEHRQRIQERIEHTTDSDDGSTSRNTSAQYSKKRPAPWDDSDEE